MLAGGYIAGHGEGYTQAQRQRADDPLGYVEGYQDGMAALLDAHFKLERVGWKVWPAQTGTDP